MDQLLMEETQPRSEPADREGLRIEHAQRRGASNDLWSALRGVFLGLLGVATIAVWAFNLEKVFGKNRPDGLEVILRLLVCDAIPLAIMIAIWRCLAHDESMEASTRRILGSIFSPLGFGPSSQERAPKER